jgi:imidazolonepropionase-like amidohydrolase
MRLTSAAFAIIILTFRSANAWAQGPADDICHGGDVVTIDDKNPTAQAVAIKDGKILAVGTKDDVLKLKGQNTKLIDLGGKALLPGFIDGHGHCLFVELAKMVRWYSSVEVLKMATFENAQLLVMCGERNPYPGKLGVVAEGALADLILVSGDPLTNIELIANPEVNFLIIMKDGKIFKNIIP